jgi:hypothetical protein
MPFRGLSDLERLLKGEPRTGLALAASGIASEEWNLPWMMPSREQVIASLRLSKPPWNSKSWFLDQEDPRIGQRCADGHFRVLA